MVRRAAVVTLAFLGACSNSDSIDSAADVPPLARTVLVFTGARDRTTVEWFAIEAALQTSATHAGLALEFAAAPAALTDAGLARRAGLVLACAADATFDAAQKKAQQHFVERGGSILVLRDALLIEPEWWWFRRLIGATKTYGEDLAEHELTEVRSAPRTSCVIAALALPKVLSERAEVLLVRTEADGVAPTPVAWSQPFDGGTCVVVGAGGCADPFHDTLVRDVIDGALASMHGVTRASDAILPDDACFDVDVVVAGLSDPIELAPLQGGDALILERKGVLKLYTATDDRVRTIHRFEVACHDSSGAHANECGGLGLTIDPQFASNRFVYVYYSPLEPSCNRLSRFTLDGAGDDARLVDERVLLEVGTDRDHTTCHEGGSLAFGPDGNLYMSTGDNTNPFESDGFAPIDDRADRTEWDAQRSAGNSNDLRGSILRIHPNADGSVSIPAGNLWPPGTPNTRPEIYVKGCRNPYRIALDPKSGAVWWGDVGPDAGEDWDGDPRGVDTLNRATQAATFGWPFARGGRFYRDRDFAKNERHASFELASINDSPRNTGLHELPTPTPPFFAYPYGFFDPLPELMDSGRNAMAGPWVWQSRVAPHLPPWFDRAMVFYDWARSAFWLMKVDEQGRLEGLHRWLANVDVPHPIDLELTNDGSFWILDYGTTWWDNADGRLLRVRFSSFDVRPLAVATAEPVTGGAPLVVHFASTDSHDSDGPDEALTFRWDFGDGATSTERSPTHEFTKPGAFDVGLVVTDGHGRDGRTSVAVVVGNTAPDVTLTCPTAFAWDAPFTYTVDVVDPEDAASHGGTLTSADATARAEVVAVYVASGDPEAAKDIEADPLLPGMDPRMKGTALLKKSGCIACHHPEQASVGPSYRVVADAIRALPESDRPDEWKRLVAKVQLGGAGRYGTVAMPPHLHVPAPAIANMIDAIAALGTDDRLKGKNGTLALPARPEHAKDAHGIYVLRAVYTDQGVPGVVALTRASAPAIVHAPVTVAKLPKLMFTKESLPALEAEFTERGAKREDECIGSWNETRTKFVFTILVPEPGTWAFALVQSAPEDQAGSSVALVHGETTLRTTIRATKGWTDYVTVDLGSITFDVAGETTLELGAETIAHSFVANVKALEVERSEKAKP